VNLIDRLFSIFDKLCRVKSWSLSRLKAAPTGVEQRVGAAFSRDKIESGFTHIHYRLRLTMFSKVYLNWRAGSGEPTSIDVSHEGNLGLATPGQGLDGCYSTLTVICLGCSSSGRGISISSIPSLNLALIRLG